MHAGVSPSRGLAAGLAIVISLNACGTPPPDATTRSESPPAPFLRPGQIAAMVLALLAIAFLTASLLLPRRRPRT